MKAKFVDEQDRSNPLDRMTIDSREQVSNLLDSFRNREPFLCKLVGENGYELMIGVGATFGCVQHSRSDGDSPYLMAAATSEGDPDVYMKRLASGELNEEEECIYFLISDQPTPIPKRYCLSFDNLKEVVSYFIETGDRWPGVPWEEI
jgi:hypothetical protein